MPKKLIKRYLPTPEKVKNFKGLGVLGKWLHNPSIWHLHRHSVAKAFMIGLFWMAIPMPSQMVAAAFSAILLRANLALSIALVWISNPFTMAPIFYFNYRIGSYLLGLETKEKLHFELSWQWILHTLGDLWMPLFLGSGVVGLVLGVSAYFLINLLWRMHVIKSWKQRRARKWRKKFRQEGHKLKK
jgi:hypothetical protein